MLNKFSSSLTKFLRLNQWKLSDKPKRTDFVRDNERIDEKAKEISDGIDKMKNDAAIRPGIEDNALKEIEYMELMEDKIADFFDNFLQWSNDDKKGFKFKRVNMKSSDIHPRETQSDSFWAGVGNVNLTSTKFALVINEKPGEDHSIMFIYRGKNKNIMISLSGDIDVLNKETGKWVRKNPGISIRWGRRKSDVNDKEWLGEKRFTINARNSSLPDTEIGIR